MGLESFDVFRLIFGSSFNVKWGWPNLKVLITHLLLVLEVCNVKSTYRKSWAGNLLMWLHLALDPSVKVKWGQPNLNVLITCLLLILEICSVRPTCIISWAGNLLMLSDLTFCPSFKVKRWFTSFVSCLSDGYKFVFVLRCKGLVVIALISLPLFLLFLYIHM